MIRVFLSRNNIIITITSLQSGREVSDFIDFIKKNASNQPVVVAGDDDTKEEKKKKKKKGKKEEL